MGKGGVFLKEKKEEVQQISDGEADAMSIFLARMMKEDKFAPDFIIGISSGAYHLVSRIKSLTKKWTMVGFVNIGIDKLEPDKKMIKNSSFDRDQNLSGVKVLVCEDDLRSGLSFMAVREFLEKKGAEVRTMSFFSHPFSKVAPDYVFKKNIDYEVSFSWDKLREYAEAKSP